MPKKGNQYKLDDEALALATQVVAVDDAAASGTSSNDNEKAKLRALLSRHLERRFVEEEDNLAKETEARSQRIKQVQLALNEIEANRNRCAHRKPDGKTSLGGQRNYDGVYRFVCSICNRTFVYKPDKTPLTVDEHAVPPELLPPTERIGSSMAG